MSQAVRAILGEPSGALVGSYRLTPASYKTCSRTLKPGEVKRVSGRGPLIGYFLACPACRFVASYLHDAVGYVEGPPAPGTTWPKSLLGITKPPPCYSCGSLLGVEGGNLVARRP